MSDHPLIWAMAKAHYEARATYGGGDKRIGSIRWSTWDELPQDFKDELYDAMWHALRAARNPTQDMIDDGVDAWHENAGRLLDDQVAAIWRGILVKLTEVK